MYFNIKSLKIKLFKSYTGTELRYLNITAPENGSLKKQTVANFSLEKCNQKCKHGIPMW